MGSSRAKANMPFDSMHSDDRNEHLALSGPVLQRLAGSELIAWASSGVAYTLGFPDHPPVCLATPVQFAAVYPHKKLQDPKVRLLLDFMAERCQRLIKDILAGK